MRLINCVTRQLEDKIGSTIPKYAILSHTWGDEEVSFADFTGRDRAAAMRKKGYQKIEYTCQQAALDGLAYCWVDTCCIDKSSSAELSEAINSMFAWYKLADRCYAYLADVSKDEAEQQFHISRWFTRGWTLQELLAPRDVTFYDCDWSEMGTKAERVTELAVITSIDEAALVPKQYGDVVYVDYRSFCVARKMSWASRRVTTREEDIAYCLLGLFDINMPLLYGEGQRAFVRLQEEIIRRVDDDSILAWDLCPLEQDSHRLLPTDLLISMKGGPSASSVLATTPARFASCSSLEHQGRSLSAITMTNIGLQIELPLAPILWQGAGEASTILGWIGILSCTLESDTDYVGILLSSVGSNTIAGEMLRRVNLDQRRDSTYLSHRTITIGPKVATKSEVRKVVIIHNENGPGRYGTVSQQRQIIILPSRAFQRLGYEVTSGDGVLMGGEHLPQYRKEWDPVSKIFTLESNLIAEDLISFRCEASGRNARPPITIFMRSDHSCYLVRMGTSFSRDGKRYFYEYLGDEASLGDAKSLTLIGEDGRSFRITVSIEKKNIHHRQIIDVYIDVVKATSEIEGHEAAVQALTLESDEESHSPPSQQLTRIPDSESETTWTS